MVRNFLGGALLVLLAGCASSSAPYVTVATANASISSGIALNPGDQLRIAVFDEPNLTGEFPVDPAGSVALPLLGKILVKGKTTSGLAQEISHRLMEGGFVLEPRVTVDVLQYRPIYVLGEVAAPGEYAFTSDLTLLQAVAKAGGFTARANQKVVLLQRSQWGGQRQVILDTEPLSIIPGDTVIVQESFF